MKKQLIALVAVISVAISSMAATNNGFKYQAVVRNNQGTVLENSSVLLKVSILEGNESGASVYSEEHQVTTNAFGLVNVVIGDGTNTIGSFASIGWATNSYYLKLEMAVGASTTLELLGVSPLLSVPYALHAETVTNNNDADPDPKNEIQDLNLTGNILTITNNASAKEIDLTQFSDVNTDNQTLSIADDSLAITSGNKVDLKPYLDNTDAQDLDLNGSQLSITGGKSVDLSTLKDADADSTNEIQDLLLTGNILKITNNASAKEIDLMQFSDVNTDEQTLSIADDSLAITSGNKVDLKPYLDNTDAQNLTLTGTILGIEGGNSFDLKVIQDGFTDADADSTNEIQDLLLTGNILKITNNASAKEIDLTQFSDVNTDEQNLSIADDSLAITSGNKVDLKPYLDNTDAQNLTLTGTLLEIDGGIGVDLAVLEDADADTTNELQILSISNDSLQISKGNKVPLPKQVMIWDTTGTTIFYNQGNVGIGTDTPTGKLEVKGSAVANPDEIIFGVLNNAGDTVFAVYQSGVRINVDDNAGKAAGSRGGFAVGGFTSGKGTLSNEYLRITPDSVRVYVNDNPVKAAGSRGGFAVGGFTSGKGIPTNEYLRITPDSVRVYVNDDAAKGAGSRGGFAVGGFTSGKGTLTNEYLRVTPDSVRVYLYDSPTKAAGSRGGFAVGGFTSGKGENANFFNISTDSTAIINPSENRVLWYPIKNAFLVGRVLIESTDSVGENSMATGFESKAIGNYTQALGYKARAFGNSSTAIGNNANAIGHSSFALGNNAQTQGLNSFAFGDKAISNGDNSYAFGAQAQALGKNSFAMGSFGYNYEGILLGPSVASGDYSYAFGMNCLASGVHSIAIGDESISTANSSMSFGRQNNATGGASLALGNYNNASGVFSTAIGNATVAIGLNATTMGFRTRASGDFSTAIGIEADATSYASMVVGMFNETASNSSTAIFPRMTVMENLRMGAITGDPQHFNTDLDRVFAIFPRLKERAAQRGGTLSGGEQQMLAIGRALMSRPRLLLLDEPSLGLAPLIVKQIFSIIREINQQQGMTVFLVEQNANHALKLAHRGYVMVNGTITLSGTGAELLTNAEVRAAYLEGGH